MNRIILYCLLALCSVHFSFAQEAILKSSKQIGIRLNKERFGIGLSTVLDIPLIKNGKLYWHQKLGVTLAHPEYDFINPNYVGWLDTYHGPDKMITTKLNYPIAGNYHSGIKYISHTESKLAFYCTLDLLLYIGEQASKYDKNQFYEKYFYYSINIVPNYGLLFRINNNINMGLDVGIGRNLLSTQTNRESKIWYNAGLNVLWNWK